jgi:hypothetical protein
MPATKPFAGSSLQSNRREFRQHRLRDSHFIEWRKLIYARTFHILVLPIWAKLHLEEINLLLLNFCEFLGIWFSKGHT